MTNPFDNEDSSYLVLVNGENQHSLWPEAIGVPPGWIVVYGPAARPECLDYIEASWTDLRPLSLTR
jgi:MbtH protein